MAIEPLISWHAPEHSSIQKSGDWYWGIGIITLTLAAVSFIFGDIITGIFVILAAIALVIHASKPARDVYVEINDRGIVFDGIFYPFLRLESFWISHDGEPPKILLKSLRSFMPYTSIIIDEVDPEHVRAVLLRYIAETEHHESLLKLFLEKYGL